ncbi:hypothetical protein AQV86_00705 [Nanohaloarchaea archaeon SG9]|nr:hypothetical protein AQV86_00705 [Nanohaloarchaea archaeon SG9]
MEAVFLGMNDAGEEVYEWLNEREDVEILALLTEKDQLSLIKELEPDIVVSSGFRHKVPGEIIDVPEKGIVNLHPSYLPYNRGSHPYIWPLVDGTPPGVSIHFMTEEIDEGPVIAKEKVGTSTEDTSKSLRKRLMEKQVELFKENWERIREGPKANEQIENMGTTHYRKELDEFSELEMREEKKVEEVIDKLKALSYTDEGLAYFEEDGQRFFVGIDITPEEELDH